MLFNFIQPSVSRYFQQVNPILEAALRAVDPSSCTRRFLENDNGILRIKEHEYALDAYEHVYLIGTGKAVLPMALAAHDCLKDRITAGFLIGKHPDRQILEQLPKHICFRTGSHPIPSQQTIDSTRELVEFTQMLTRNDLVVCLISGGGSALMSLPYEPITLDEMQETTRQLLRSGAAINEVNTIRKHLDQVKGGGLARLIAPAQSITLVLSDVIGDALDAIASGPTVADDSTFQLAWDIVNKFGLATSLPESVSKHLKEGLAGRALETVKSGDDCLSSSATAIVGSLRMAAEAAQEQAQKMGFHTGILTTCLQGEAREKGAELANILKDIVIGDHPLKKPACLLAGGETTVTVHGDGKGGRNQELALSAARVLDGLKNCLFISLATDGEDGPTDAAGAAVHGETIQKGIQMGMDAGDYLKRNDAYHFLQRSDNLIFSGPTGTNVNDLILMFAFDSQQQLMDQQFPLE